MMSRMKRISNDIERFWLSGLSTAAAKGARLSGYSVLSWIS